MEVQNRLELSDFMAIESPKLESVYRDDILHLIPYGCIA